MEPTGVATTTIGEWIVAAFPASPRPIPAEIDARASYQLEGTVQEIQPQQPNLAERLPRALHRIRERLRPGRA